MKRFLGKTYCILLHSLCLWTDFIWSIIFGYYSKFLLLLLLQLLLFWCCYCRFFFCHFIIVIVFFHYFRSYSLFYVSYYFVSLLGILIIYGHGVFIPFYPIFNICNFSITFFIALSWILFSFLLTVSLIKFPYSIILMTI